MTDQAERPGAGPLQPPAVDMSPEAIDRRMRELAQLYRLGLSIRTARRLGKLRDLRGQDPKPDRRG